MNKIVQQFRFKTKKNIRLQQDKTFSAILQAESKKKMTMYRIKRK
jgi:hypothetical protein